MKKNNKVFAEQQVYSSELMKNWVQWSFEIFKNSKVNRKKLRKKIFARKKFCLNKRNKFVRQRCFFFLKRCSKKNFSIVIKGQCTLTKKFLRSKVRSEIKYLN